METIASREPSTKCVKCGTALIRPEWSESVGEHETTRFWHCANCGHEFESTDNVVEPKPTDAELVEEFLPNLLVG